MNDQFRKFVVVPDGVARTATRDGNLYVEVDDNSYLVYVHENDTSLATPRNLDRAADKECFSVQDLKELWNSTEVEAPTVKGVAKWNNVDVDDLITKYAERLQDVYDYRTAGDHTFVGVLFMFLQELEGQ